MYSYLFTITFLKLNFKKKKKVSQTSKDWLAIIFDNQVETANEEVPWKFHHRQLTYLIFNTKIN